MPDQKPSRLTGDERDTLLALLQYQRDSLVRNVTTATDAVRPADTLEAAIDAYRATWPRVDAIVAATPTVDEPCRHLGDDPPVNLRWVLMHLLEETARHAGHADVLRELVDGHTGR